MWCHWLCCLAVLVAAAPDSITVVQLRSLFNWAFLPLAMTFCTRICADTCPPAGAS